jgi:multidrug efflux pump subunit AcrA (membrane-fusion protein)
MNAMSKTPATLLTATALAAVLSVHAACGSAPDEQAAAGASPLVVDTVTAARTSMPETLEAGGLVQATLTATVASRLLADVRTVHVVAGEPVRRGQALVTLDARDLASAHAQAIASVAAVTQSRAAAEAERAAAEAALVLADATHGRIAGLHEKRAATTHELDQSRAALTAARGGGGGGGGGVGAGWAGGERPKKE